MNVPNVDEARRTSFERKADLYDASRPSYPDALVDDLMARCDPARMLEIGAGTGKATRGFARTGRELVALEPAAGLAAILRRHVGALAHVRIEETSFEAYEDGGGFDLIYAAQAFHWTDPALRYTKTARLLRPGGALAVITNEKAPLGPELRRELDQVYARWSPETDRPADEIEDARQSWTAEIAASDLFASPDVLLFPWTASYTARAYVDLVDTYSDTIVLPDEQRTGLTTGIASVIERHGGQLEISYVAMVFLARRPV